MTLSSDKFLGHFGFVSEEHSGTATMIKADLARIVHQHHGGISYREAKDIVERIIDQIKSRLVEGESVKLSGFGSMKVVNRKQRVGRNPQTGETIMLRPRRYVTFRLSKTVKF